MPKNSSNGKPVTVSAKVKVSPKSQGKAGPSKGKSQAKPAPKATPVNVSAKVKVNPQKVAQNQRIQKNVGAVAQENAAYRAGFGKALNSKTGIKKTAENTRRSPRKQGD